jgi:DNA-binding CsgD family transcriptional regulator
MTNIQIPSGIIDENIELFSTTGKMMALHNGAVKNLFDLPLKFMETLEWEMHKNPSTIIALKLAGFKTREQQLEKFSECRFGGFDLTADFKDGKLSDTEYHECGFRGECPMEGIVCGFFRVKGHIITPFDIHMIKLLSTEDTLPVIAEKMQVCMNTFEIKKKLLYEKLGVLSRARLVAICYELQILMLKPCS